MPAARFHLGDGRFSVLGAGRAASHDVLSYRMLLASNHTLNRTTCAKGRSSMSRQAHILSFDDVKRGGSRYPEHQHRDWAELPQAGRAVRASVPRKPRAAKARLCCPIFPRTRLRSRIPKRGPSSIPRGSVAAPPVPPASAAKPLPSSVVPLAFPRKSAMSAPRSRKRGGSRQPIAVAPRPRRAPRPRPAARSRSSSAGKRPRATIPRAQPCTKGRWAQASVVPSACRSMRLRRRATAAVRAFPKTPLWAPWAPARS